MGLIIAIAGSQLAVSLVNLASTLLVKPKRFPKLDFSKGVPDIAKTLVIVPTMLGSLAAIESMVEALEVRFLGNRTKNIYFGLLTDFNDSNKEHQPTDEILLNTLIRKISDLNKHYVRTEEDIFFLFHRSRQWNESEHKWMGKERKRGKLSDLNDFLLGKKQDNFSLLAGSASTLKNIKYVITLDTDTQLPRDVAKYLIGTMEHPLNRPHYDTQKQCITNGHSILQLRIAESLPSQNLSRYLWLSGNEFGIDPYTL